MTDILKTAMELGGEKFEERFADYCWTATDPRIEILYKAHVLPQEYERNLFDIVEKNATLGLVQRFDLEYKLKADFHDLMCQNIQTEEFEYSDIKNAYQYGFAAIHLQALNEKILAADVARI